MPILWRYLLSQYLKVLCLCVLAFIAVLLTTRLEEIAHFITLGAQGFYILWFVLYQIPYILPIALPISCLISAILLIQRLSLTHELTAMRACGINLRDILMPILVASAFLTLCNFYVISEMATQSHLTTSLLKNELRSVNPLVLLRNKQLLRVKGIYFDTLGPSQAGESASDIVLAMPNKNNSRLNVMVAKKLQANSRSFTGRDVTLISSMGSDDSNRFDHLMLENIKQATTSVHDFTQMVQKKAWTLNNDHLRISLLLVRLHEQKEDLAQAREDNVSSVEQKQISRSIDRVYSEIIRRLSVAFAVFTFTFMGVSFGIGISRSRSNRGLFFVIGLASLYLISYFVGKGIDHLLLAASLLYTVPHLIIIGLSAWNLNRISKGIE
jgi:lipopolysaccharide export system permease protein